MSLPPNIGDPGSWNCTHQGCGAAAGSPCHNEDGTPFIVDGQPGYHFERRSPAAYWSTPHGEQTPEVKDELDKAIDETGMV